MSASENPILSVVVAIVSDTTDPQVDSSHLKRCVAALDAQINAPSVEILVPYHKNVADIDQLREELPHVRFIGVQDLKMPEKGGREHHDVIRAHGLAAARGDYVGLIEDHARPDENWCAETVKAHQSDYAGIGGAIENGVDRLLNWAVYFCDFGKYQNPLPAGATTFSSDANTIYKRSALNSIRATWEDSFREVVVNHELISKGAKVALDPNIIIYQNRTDLKLGAVLRERYIWGLSYAATRNQLLSTPKRLIYGLLSPLLPLILMRKLAATAWERRTHFSTFLKALPYTTILLVSWSVGEGIGYLTGANPQSRHVAGS